MKMTTLNYKHTIFSCFMGFVCQAIIVNFAPLLFITFSSQYSIPMSEITLLVTVNFAVQLVTDLFASKYADKLGYRFCLVLAHLLCSVGLIFMTFLPELMGGLAGLLVSVVLYAIGGGLLEVLLSPVIEASPVENKRGALSLLHSFYCFGVVGTVVLSTLFFHFFGTENWKILSLIWAIVPFANAIVMLLVPISDFSSADNSWSGLKKLFTTGLFWVFLLLMVCSGASEQAVHQWASAFTESALQVDKTVGDVIGVSGFALMMGIARSLYGKFGDKLSPRPTLMLCALMTVVSYLLITLTTSPALGLIGCVLTGLSVGIMWPGTFSYATSSMPIVNTAMFAFLSLAGDLGCSAGPTVVGTVSSAFGGNLKSGILAAIVFPITLLIVIFFMKKPKSDL